MRITSAHIVFAILANATDVFWRALRRDVVHILSWAVDAARWFGRERVRRTGRQAGAHRDGRSVWDLLHARPDEEQDYEWIAQGKHRDERGWRYPSAVWSLIERTRDEREDRAYWKMTINRLMEEIQYMLDHPPVPETVHGCQDCLCGQIAEIRRGALA